MRPFDHALGLEEDDLDEVLLTRRGSRLRIDALVRVAPDRPIVRCPLCGAACLRVGGRLWDHVDPGGRTPSLCPGSGRDPSDLSTS